MNKPVVDYCDECKAELYGELGVKSEVIRGIPVVTISEITPRNWILCDSCNALLCHNCCLFPKTGYCNNCQVKQDSSGVKARTKGEMK